MSSYDLDIRELIPLYVSGQLDDAQRLRVEAAAEADQEIADELAIYTAMSAAVKSAPKDNTPGELGWARLSRAIDAEEALTEPSKAANDQTSWRGWKYAAAALAVIATGQAALLTTSQGVLVADNSGQEELYVPVSEEMTTYQLQVIFQGTATVDEIQDILRANDGSIVAGPSAIGLYQVEFQTQEAADAARASFKGASDLISDVR